MVDNKYAAFFNYTPVGWPDLKLFTLVGWPPGGGRSFLSVAWPTGVQLSIFILLREIQVTKKTFGKNQYYGGVGVNCVRNGHGSKMGMGRNDPESLTLEHGDQANRC